MISAATSLLVSLVCGFKKPLLDGIHIPDLPTERETFEDSCVWHLLHIAGVSSSSVWPYNNSNNATATPTASTTTIQYDTRCYFNVRSKADMSRINLPHGNCCCYWVLALES